jgi:periplasmic divalent cation tolerance protein
MPPVPPRDLIVVVTSVGTEEQALDVAHALVRGRQAACVNIVPNIHSVYRWKGRVCDDGEMLLIVKTRASSFDAVRETIHKVNTYELPEVLAYKVDWASPGFASWIEKMTAVRSAARSAPKSEKAKARPPARAPRKRAARARAPQRRASQARAPRSRAAQG